LPPATATAVGGVAARACLVETGRSWTAPRLIFELTHHPQRADLCVKYPFVGPPLSPEQVRRQLGL